MKFLLYSIGGIYLGLSLELLIDTAVDSAQARASKMLGVEGATNGKESTPNKG